MRTSGYPGTGSGILIPFMYWGVLFTTAGILLYFAAILLSIVRLLAGNPPVLAEWVRRILWLSGFPTTIGILLAATDIALLSRKRRFPRKTYYRFVPPRDLTIALTAYNDEASIAEAVADFKSHPLVSRVIVVSNNSSDRTLERAIEAGAIGVNEPAPGYGSCVYRCLKEFMACSDSEYFVLCEGDRTFRAYDLDKLAAFLPHADIVNGTRIVEQLRAYDTQLSTFMYYGNFFVGKLLEVKHFGKGTFTDVGTTYKLITREALERLLPRLDPRVNLEFNAHFLDTALDCGIRIVECPITFHARVGASKGGNTNNARALKVGLRMILGLTFGWRVVR